MSVKFSVQRRPSGQYVMTLTSGQPINEPFIDVLVELNWANGRLVREYTFLLDPPEYAGPPKLKALQAAQLPAAELEGVFAQDRKSTRLNSSHITISYAVFCL